MKKLPTIVIQHCRHFELSEEYYDDGPYEMTGRFTLTADELARDNPNIVKLMECARSMDKVNLIFVFHNKQRDVPNVVFIDWRDYGEASEFEFNQLAK